MSPDFLFLYVLKHRETIIPSHIWVSILKLNQRNQSKQKQPAMQWRI